MDIATGTWFKYLRDGEETPKKPKGKTLLTESSRGEHEKPLLTEISREEHERLKTWIMNQGDINPELDDVFGGPGKMRVAFPMAGPDARNLAQIVAALMNDGWKPPYKPAGFGANKFDTKVVKQKGKRRVGELPADFGMPHPQTNPDPRPVEAYYEDKTVAALDVQRTFDFTIPAGPRKGEKIEKTDKSTMSRAIAKLVKQGKLDDELLEWWNKRQIYYTNDNKWEDVQELFDMTATEHKYSIIVSRVPIDILRMSDIGRISSCHREGGEYFQCAREEARGHGIVAYRLYTDVLNKFLSEKTTEEEAQELVLTTILQHYQRYKALRKNLNDAELFEFGVDAIKREWKNQPQEVMDAVTYNMVREAIRATDDFDDNTSWPPPDLNPEAELKPLSDFDDEEIFQDTDRDVSGIIANERVRLRKFYDSANHQYFVVPENATYGAKQPGYASVVRGWAWDNQKDLFIDDDGELQPPRPQDLIRFGGSWGDTSDGILLNSFFDKARPDESYDPLSLYSGNMGQDTGTEEEEDHEDMEAQLEEAQEQIEEIMQAASNRAEHVSVYGEADLYDDEHISVQGTGNVSFVFPIGWEGKMEPKESGYYWPDEERDQTTIPKTWGGGDPIQKRQLANILERHLNFYSEDTNWEVESASGSTRKEVGPGYFELRVYMSFTCDDCNDVDDFDNFVDSLIGDVDDNYDEIYEKTRRELVEEGYLPPNDWDRLLDDIKESNEELGNWRAYGIDEDEYEGEVTFYFEPEGERTVQLGIKFPKEIGNTLFAMEKIFKGEGSVGGRLVNPGMKFRQRLEVVLSDLQEQANGYAKTQLDLNFGDKYSRPTFEGVKFSHNSQLRFDLTGGYVQMYFKIIIDSKESTKDWGAEEVEGAMAFMKYVDQYPDEIIKGVRDNFKVFMDEYLEYVEVRSQKMEDGTTFWEVFERVRSKFEAQADTGNPDAEQAILVAMWGRDNWDEMSKIEKYTLINSYLRPLVSGATHPRNAWSALSDLPLNWNAYVQSMARGTEFNAPRHVWADYSWATHHPDSDQAGLSDEQKDRAKVLAWLYKQEYGPDHGGPVRPAGWSDADWKLVMTEIPDLERFADEPGHQGEPGEDVGYYERAVGYYERAVRAREAALADQEERWNDPLGTRRRAAAREAGGVRQGEPIIATLGEPQPVGWRPPPGRSRNRADMLATLNDEDRSAAMDALVAGDREEFMRIARASEEEDKPGDAYKRAKDVARARKAATGGDRPMEEEILRIDKALNERFDLRLYVMQIQLVIRKLEGREIDDLKNTIRGIKHVTTVKTVSKRNIAEAQRVVFELKYEQKGIVPREDFIRFDLLPMLKKMPGIEVEEWSRPEIFERGTLREYFNPNTYASAMTTPKASLEQISRDWVEGGVRIYDMPAHAQDMQYHLMMPVAELLPYISRIYRAPMDAFEGRYHHFIKKGAQAPVFVVIGQNGRIKIAGNEDIVWFAKKAGLKEVPVFVRYQKQA